MLLRYMIDWFQKKFFFILSINVTSFLIILQNGDQIIRWLIKRFDKLGKSSWAALIGEGHLVCF